MQQFWPATQTPPMPRSKKGTGNFNLEDWGSKGGTPDRRELSTHNHCDNLVKPTALNEPSKWGPLLDGDSSMHASTTTAFSSIYGTPYTCYSPTLNLPTCVIQPKRILSPQTPTPCCTHRPGNLFCHPRVPGTDLRTLTPYVSMGLFCSGTHNERKHAMHVPVRLS